MFNKIDNEYGLLSLEALEWLDEQRQRDVEEMTKEFLGGTLGDKAHAEMLDEEEFWQDG